MYFVFLNIHRWLNIANITPHDSDDGSEGPKRYCVNFAINLSFHLDYLIINLYIYIYIYILYCQRIHFQMLQGWSSGIYCLHCRFRVIKHHIGSDSNPDLGPELRGHLLDNFVLHNFLFSNRQNSYLLSSALTNRKISFSNPCVYKGNYTLHSFHFITRSQLPFLLWSFCFFSFFSKFTPCISCGRFWWYHPTIIY